MINYHQLLGVLQKLELGVPSIISQPAGFPGSAAVRAGTNSKVQVFGLDSSIIAHKVSRGNLPVVVAIGSNYTQGATPVPRDMKPLFGVEDHLKSCRSNVRAGFRDYLAHKVQWYDNCIASSPTITIPPGDDFHLVMTNVCLWITQDFWQGIRTPTRADLLENNPLFNANTTCPGKWAHLLGLDKALGAFKKLHVIWVGHGIDSEVFALLRQFMCGKKPSDWLLMPNLARSYNYTKWGHSKLWPRNPVPGVACGGGTASR